MSKYPDTPGWKGRGLSGQTSAAAAHEVSKSVKTLRIIALRTLSLMGKATALEAVIKSGLDPCQLRPRFSELKNNGLLETTGVRRKNPTGKMACELKLTDAGRKALEALK
jgi:hypothetical protein